MGLLVAWFGIVDPAWSWFNDRTALLEQRQAMLVHMRGLAETLPALRTASADKRGQGVQTASIMLYHEDTRELVVPQINRVHMMYAKDGKSLQKAGAKELLESALRMRPDRILLQELRETLSREMSFAAARREEVARLLLAERRRPRGKRRIRTRGNGSGPLGGR